MKRRGRKVQLRLARSRFASLGHCLVISGSCREGRKEAGGRDRHRKRSRDGVER